MRQEKPADDILQSLRTEEEFRGHQSTGNTELEGFLAKHFGDEIHFTLVGVASATSVGEACGITRSNMRTLGWADYPTNRLPQEAQRAMPSSTEVMVIRKDLLNRIRASEVNEAITRCDPKINAGDHDPDDFTFNRVAQGGGGVVRVGTSNT